MGRCVGPGKIEKAGAAWTHLILSDYACSSPLLRDKTREEVLDLLGAPDESHEGQLRYKVDIGRRIGWRPFPVSLFVEFDGYWYSYVMRPLRYSINVTLDGCCDHHAIDPDEDLHRHAVENLNRADALLFGRVTYEMMEVAFRPPARKGERPDWMEPFARTIDAAKKYVVSSTLGRVDWNAELVPGDLGKAVQQLKRESGKGLLVAGVKLPLALAELGLIDEYEFVVHPRLAGHGPTLFVDYQSVST